jgi:hypothetical protein
MFCLKILNYLSTITYFKEFLKQILLDCLFLGLCLYLNFLVLHIYNSNFASYSSRLLCRHPASINSTK